MPKNRPGDGLDLVRAGQILRTNWDEVCAKAAENPNLQVMRQEGLREAIHKSINHSQVAYRFCLPIQLLGKMTQRSLDCLRLQKRKGDPADTTGWDARSLGSKVVAPFNREQEGILGTSADPYVGNPMRIPKMLPDDKSKKDLPGWNALVGVLQEVEERNDPQFTAAAFRQVLLEMYRRQQTLRFTYPIPPRVSLESALSLARQFLEQRSGGDRALALTGALFDAIGQHFRLYVQVNRARINASDEATGLAADLECLDAEGKIVLAVEVKDRRLTLSDLEGTLRKSRQREIRDVLFATAEVNPPEQGAITERINRAFSAGHNLYVFDFFDLARSLLAIGGEALRATFLRKVGEHLDQWNTQPRNRQDWKKLLETL